MKYVDLEKGCLKDVFPSRAKAQYLLQNTFCASKTKFQRLVRKEALTVNTHSHNRTPLSRAARKSSVPKLFPVTAYKNTN